MNLRSSFVLWVFASACSGGEVEPAPGVTSPVPDRDGGAPTADQDGTAAAAEPDASASIVTKEPADAGGDAAEGVEVEDVEDVEFEIPLAPVDEGSLAFFVEEEAADEATPDVHVARLAFGAGYPDVMNFELASLVLYSSSGALFSTELTLEAATSMASGLEVRVSGERRIEVEVREAGTHTFQLDAVANFEGGTTRHFSLPVSVAAIPVTDVDWSTCSAPLVVVSGSPMGATRLYPLDEVGNPFEPRNTEFNRGADLIVRAGAGTLVEAPTGIDSLLITGPSQTIEVHSDFGPVATLELIQPEEVDGISPMFVSSEGGARGGSAGVTNGGELSVDFAAQPYVSVHPGPRFGGIPLCGSLDPRLFELRSNTPEVCTIQANGCAERGCSTSEYVPAIANLIAPGTCSLQLDAPTLDHGHGLSADFTATFNQL